MQLKQGLESMLTDIASCSSDGNLFHNTQPLYWIDVNVSTHRSVFCMVIRGEGHFSRSYSHATYPKDIR